MEGKVSKELLLLQHTALVGSPSRLTIKDWAKQFISQLLHISHAQWVFRNVSLHDKNIGYLQRLQRQKVLMEIDRLSQLNPSDLPLGSRYLLEIDFSTPQNSSLIKQSYWILAMKAAICAGQRVQRRSTHTAQQNLQRRRAPGQRNRQTPTTPTHDLSTGFTSWGAVTRGVRHARQLNQHNVSTVDGTGEALREIQLEWLTDPPPSRRRPHPSSTFLEFQDVKQRRPD